MRRFSFFSLVIICLVAQSLWANETTPEVSPTNNVTVVDSAEIADSAEITDATHKTEEDFKRLEKGFFLSPSWQFGKSPLISTWYENQLQKKEYYDTLFKADTSVDYSSVFTQRPTDQSISFPFSLGFYRAIDSTKGFTIGLDYAFQKKKSIFTYKNKKDTTLLYENSSSITTHRVSLLATYEFIFNNEYFSVKGFPRTGLTLGLGVSPCNLVQLKNNSKKTIENRYGGVWSAGIFTEKNISKNIMRRVTIFYTGTLSQPYNDLAEQLPLYAGEKFLRTGSFGIKLIFIFSKTDNEAVTEK